MFTKQKTIFNAEHYKSVIPASAALLQRKAQLDEMLRENLFCRQRFVVVCGPCSADREDAMEQYLSRLKSVADKCSNLLVVARVYTSKPHSNGVGYKGTAFHLTEADDVDIDEGICRCRRMMLHCLELGLPVADELLFPSIYECLDDLVGYWFVGARSCEDSHHRALASGLDVCCGVKNALDGDLNRMIDSLFAIGNPAVFPYNGSQWASDGCKYAHAVLRGGNRNGTFFSNLDGASVQYVKEKLRKLGLNDFVMADLNHGNSGKVAANQPKNAFVAVDAGVDGVMMESYLFGGAAKGVFGTSQTDDCLDWHSTEELLLELNERCTKLQ